MNNYGNLHLLTDIYRKVINASLIPSQSLPSVESRVNIPCSAQFAAILSTYNASNVAERMRLIEVVYTPVVVNQLAVVQNYQDAIQR